MEIIKCEINNEEFQKEHAFQLVVAAGEIQLQSGAEITRVEETMKHMAKALDIESLETYIIANGIFTTAEGTHHMQRAGMKHISTGDTDLRKIEAVNTLSRELEKGTCSIEEAWKRIDEIRALGDYPPHILIPAYCIGAGSFCYALGGSGNDAFVAGIVGLLLGIFFHILGRWNISKAIRTILGSMLVSILTIKIYEMGLGDATNRIMVGALIPMIPGVSFTNAIRDFVENDYVSGLIRLMDVLLILVSIVVGVGVTWGLPGFSLYR